jgi:hypothetical protein
MPRCWMMMMMMMMIERWQIVEVWQSTEQVGESKVPD